MFDVVFDPIFSSVLKIEESDCRLRHVCPSIRLSVKSNYAPTGRIFMKFSILSIFRKNMSRKLKFH